MKLTVNDPSCVNEAYLGVTMTCRDGQVEAGSCDLGTGVDIECIPKGKSH